MNVEFKKVSTLLTQDAAKELVKRSDIVIVAETSEGIEIRDMRGLVERLESPITGRGVLRYFGDTHMIITKKLAVKVGAKV